MQPAPTMRRKSRIVCRVCMQPWCTLIGTHTQTMQGCWRVYVCYGETVHQHSTKGSHNQYTIGLRMSGIYGERKSVRWLPVFFLNALIKRRTSTPWKRLVKVERECVKYEIKWNSSPSLLPRLLRGKFTTYRFTYTACHSEIKTLDLIRNEIFHRLSKRIFQTKIFCI